MIDRDALIDGIYEAAVVPERWPSVLEQMGASVDTPAVCLLTRRSDEWIGYTTSKPIEQPFLAYLATDIAQRSQTTPRLLAKDHAGFLSNDDLFSSNEWEQEPFRREWGRPWGYNAAAATAITLPSDDFLVFHLQRREQDAPFNASDIRALDSFRPHLARAGLLSVRWRLQQLRAATEALALIGLPAAIVSRHGRVLAANAPIEAMTNHVRWLAGDRLAMVDPIANSLLAEALAGLFRPHAGIVQSIASRASSGDAAVLHIVPTVGQARDVLAGGLAILALTPVTVPEAPDAALIRALFDLSAGEARAARGIARGDSIDDIAKAAGVSRETVRTQVKGAMAKTGTSRQAEMAALLAGLPTRPQR